VSEGEWVFVRGGHSAMMSATMRPSWEAVASARPMARRGRLGASTSRVKPMS
jgi:hypothetical protein